MSVASKHPSYEARESDWEKLRDTRGGEDVVKAAEDTYLPATQSQIDNGYPAVDSDGWQAYQAYLTRAVFPELVQDAEERLVGAMIRKPAVFDLPDAMRDLETFCTPSGDTLQTLLTKIYTAQMVPGRQVLVADVPEPGPDGRQLPWIVEYPAESLINWVIGVAPDGSDQLQYAVLDESGAEFDPAALRWVEETAYRVLALADAVIDTPMELDAGEDAQRFPFGIFVYGETEDENLPVKWIPVTAAGNEPMTRIPLTVINPLDLAWDPAQSPLIGLARQALTIYRGEADYRQSLFMQGQDTLMVAGGATNEDGTPTSSRQVGSLARIDVELGGDAKYVGVNSEGLPEQRRALENDYKRAEARSGHLLTQNNNAESGAALQVRVASRTTTLVRIALTGAAGLRQALQDCGRLMGLDEGTLDNIKVTPNLDFVENETSRVLLELVQAKNQGAPISWETIHELMRKWDLTGLTYNEETDKIEGEISFGPVPIQVNPVPDEPLDDEDEDAVD